MADDIAPDPEMIAQVARAIEKVFAVGLGFDKMAESAIRAVREWDENG